MLLRHSSGRMRLFKDKDLDLFIYLISLFNKVSRGLKKKEVRSCAFSTLAM